MLYSPHCIITDCSHCVIDLGKKTEHNPGCDSDRKCCHEQCLGGCEGPGSASKCYVCKKVYHEGECLDRCPATNSLDEDLLEVRWYNNHCY